MRILYISEIYPDVKRGLGVWGGGERQFYEISKRMAKREHQVTVLTCRFPSQPSGEIVNKIKINRIGLTRDSITGGARRAIWPIMSYSLKTAKKAMKLEADLIHCNTYFPVFPGEIAARLKHVAIVVTFHDIYGLREWIRHQQSILWGSLGHLLETFVAKLAQHRIICVSPQCEQKLIDLGVPNKRITIIPNGVDLKLFNSIRTKKVHKQVLYVGRLVNFKHVDWLIRAFVLVLRKRPNATLKIVGDGPERRRLEVLTKKLRIQTHVKFTGLTPTYEAVARYFKESEVFVLPSTMEGEGIVLKEAMAAGLPLIAIKVPTSGVLSLVKDGKNGFLVEPNSPELIAEKLVQLLENEKLRKNMGIEGQNFVRKYDWDVIANRTLQIYQDITGK